MPASDIVIPFMFEKLPVRGALVQLQSAWQRMHDGRNYPAPVLEVLGHAAAAGALIAQSLKFEGNATLQISGDGPVSMLVMQCSSQLELRGMAHAEDGIAELSYREMLAHAQCAITVDGKDIERPYQGIVEVSGDSLADSLESYFERSAQIASHLALVSDRGVAGGLLLQQMPNTNELDDDDWRRLGMLAATLRPQDLAEGVGVGLLGQLFAEDDLRVFGSRDAVFRCRCTQERTEDVLRMLGEEEAQSAIDADGQLDVTCEYCGRRRHFDAVDIKRLFAAPPGPSSGRVH